MCASLTHVTMLVTLVIILASSVSLVTPAHSWRHAAINPSIVLIFKLRDN